MRSARIDRPNLDGQHFEVVVIGGGINGVAIARECALAGKHTLLLEKHDFGSGTTSRSTRIFHGGLRYLEHGELGLVRESLRERGRMLRQQPHLVRPMQFLLALQPGNRHSALAVRAGLWLYSAFGEQLRNLHNTKSEIQKLESLLDRGRQWSIFSYHDAQCEFPERLVADWLYDAVEVGAVPRNHTTALNIQIKDGRACGVFIRDELNGTEQKIQGAWIINATGPWADRVCEPLALRKTKRMIGGVRGSHIVLPSPPGAPHAIVYSEATDGRAIFVAPWNGQLLVGTTEIADDGDPATTTPSSAEIDYLLRSVSQLLPSPGFSLRDIRYAYAGVRSLPYSPGKPAAAITRRHFLHDHSEEGAAGMISVIGGKLTTAAVLARECARKIGIAVQEPSSSVVAVAPEDGIVCSLRQWAKQISGFAGIREASARAIAEWHGRRALTIARMAASCELYREPLCPHTEHLVAEAMAAVQSECAVTLADLLLRRVPVALGSCWDAACGRSAAQRISKAIGWSEARMGAEFETLEMERAAFLPRASNAQMPPMLGACVDRSERFA